MKRAISAIFCIVFSLAVVSARAQVVPAATSHTFSLSAGALGSGFQPDYAGEGIAQTSPNRLYGVGAYVDARFSRWVQIEAEGRWLHYNTYLGINENTYLIGPRIPICQLPRPVALWQSSRGDGQREFPHRKHLRAGLWRGPGLPFRPQQVLAAGRFRVPAVARGPHALPLRRQRGHQLQNLLRARPLPTGINRAEGSMSWENFYGQQKGPLSERPLIFVDCCCFSGEAAPAPPQAGSPRNDRCFLGWRWLRRRRRALGQAAASTWPAAFGFENLLRIAVGVAPSGQ